MVRMRREVGNKIKYLWLDGDRHTRLAELNALGIKREILKFNNHLMPVHVGFTNLTIGQPRPLKADWKQKKENQKGFLILLK